MQSQSSSRCTERPTLFTNGCPAYFVSPLTSACDVVAAKQQSARRIMASDIDRSFQTPRREKLGLLTITNAAGLSVSALPNGTLFAIEHSDPKGLLVMLNQVLGSLIHGGIGRLYLRTGGAKPFVTEIVGPGAAVHFGVGDNAFSWTGETDGIHHSVRL